MEQIVLEQFLNDLEERTQRWVHQHSPTICEEALKLAEAFAASEVHYLREKRVPTPILMTAREPERQQLNPRGPVCDVVCFHCGRTGHFSRECPNRASEEVAPG